jgi:biopolymer transport protein ExbD
VKFRSRLTVETGIPVAAMADIAFLLIFFFLLTSTFAKDIGLDVSLPKAATSEELPKRDITIWITRGGEVHIGNQVVPPQRDQLAAALRGLLKNETPVTVTIRGDEGVNYGDVVRVMDVAKLCGASITLAAVYEEGSEVLAPAGP